MTRKLLLALYTLSAWSGAALVQAEELPFFSSQTDLNHAALQSVSKDDALPTGVNTTANTDRRIEHTVNQAAISTARQQFAELPAQYVATVQKYKKTEQASAKSDLTGFGNNDDELGVSFYPLNNDVSFSVTFKQNPKDETDPYHNDPFHEDANHNDPNFR
ncbi:hypothetical protein [Shewanella sp.]|uniref:hypothetical protein n=1 Tax=Shewanella sp. TaxID=50422 RepID=UPI003A97E341